MKTRLILLAAFLLSLTAASHAFSPKKKAVKPESIMIELIIDIEKLAPSLIHFSPFADGHEAVAEPAIDVARLTPVTPEVADFEEIPLDFVNIEKLAPATGYTAGFEDAPETADTDLMLIAPKAPEFAEFND